MPPDELRAWLAFVRIPGLGPSRGARLQARHGSPAQVFAAGDEAWLAAGLGDASRAALANPDHAAVDDDLEWLTQLGSGFVAIDDPRLSSAAAPDRSSTARAIHAR
jgi:DNA processing protein